MRLKEKCIMTIFLVICSSVFAVNVMGGRRLGSYLFDNIVILGSTNINHFQFVYNEQSFSNLDINDTSRANRLMISIPATKFKTDSKLMYRDFLQLINAKEHPLINISLGENFSSCFFSDSLKAKHSVKITINGVTNSYNCISKLNRSYYNEWQLFGKLKVKLSDFQIDPPVKFFGVVKVKDEVFITFRILFLLDNNEISNEI